MTRRARIALTICVLAGVQLAAIGVYVLVQRARTPTAAFAVEPVAERAPTIVALRRDGAPVTFTWPARRVRLVHFWATWCPPCVDELPSLLALAREAPDVEVIAIAVDDDWQDIDRFFGGDIPAEVVVESSATAHAQFGVSTLPDTYLVGADGVIRERYAGARDWRSPAARARLR